MRKIIFLIILCVTGTFLNTALHLLTTGENLLPLYLDTVFTITVTLLGGPILGCLTGALTNFICHTNNFWGWEGYLFALCNIATAIITWLFMRIFPGELNLTHRQIDPAATGKNQAFAAHKKILQLDKVMNLIFVLLLLSFALCLTISILGGLISVFIEILRSTGEVNPASPPNSFYSGVPLVLREILSRIPINIIDRFISAFFGFGFALLVTFIRGVVTRGVVTKGVQTKT